MTISTNLADLLQLAEFEGILLTALSYQSLGLDELDEAVQIDGESPHSMAVQHNVIYGLEFGRAQGRFLTTACADMVSSIRTMSDRLDPDLHKRITVEGYHDGRGDLEIARLESL